MRTYGRIYSAEEFSYSWSNSVGGEWTNNNSYTKSESHSHLNWSTPHTLETRNVTGCAIHCERIIVARSNDKRTLLGGRVFSFNRDWEIVELRRVYLSVREHHKLQLIKNVQNVELIRGLSSKSSSSSVALPEHRL